METFETTYGKISIFKNETYIIKPFIRGDYWDINNLLSLKPYIDPNKNILEIGGHCGTSTLVYASFLNEGSKIFVYEPQRRLFDLLVHNIKQNNLEHKIIPFNYGVFCYSGSGKMNEIDVDGGGGNVVKRYTDEIDKPCNFGGISLGDSGEEIKMITIDDMGHDNIGFIHCDAQGAENFIFSKAEDTIRKNRPVILMENNYEYAPYLYNNVCKAYPQFVNESRYNLADFCRNELKYSNIIKQFNGSEDDLMIP